MYALLKLKFSHPMLSKSGSQDTVCYLQSELAFRMLCREYGATAAYTPMLHGRIFSESAKYRDEFFTTCPGDRYRTAA